MSPCQMELATAVKCCTEQSSHQVAISGTFRSHLVLSSQLEARAGDQRVVSIAQGQQAATCQWHASESC